MIYFLIQVFRRIFYVYSIFGVPIESIQLILLLYLNIATTIYFGKIRPKIGKFFNRLEMFNEAMFQVVCFHQFLFTAFVPDFKLKFNIGWSQMLVIIFLILINLSLIIYFAFMKLRLYLIKYCNIFK